jgi:taurine dioxygenase
MGQININRFFKAMPGYPQIAEVRKEPAQATNMGGGWHTDYG